MKTQKTNQKSPNNDLIEYFEKEKKRKLKIALFEILIAIIFALTIYKGLNYLLFSQ